MKVKRMVKIINFTALSLALVFSIANAKDNKDDSTNLHNLLNAKTATLEHELWDGNQISTYHGNHGDFVSYHVTGNSGLEWPKGSQKTAVFQAGLWLAGIVDNSIRTAAAEYTCEFEPGPYAGNPDDAGNRIYRIYKAEIVAMLAGLSTANMDLNNDGTAETVSIPTRDYREWPVSLGAPFVDVDGDGAYDYTIDYPDILGDQFHWYVMNDGNPDIHTPLWATQPLNIEVQTSIFGFDRPPNDALGNTMFIRWVMVNKGTQPIDSMFVSIWHDDDVGDANDDFVGCDTSLSVGFTYNDGSDVTYGTAAPVSGSDFFQGPTVPSPGDTATILTWSKELGYHKKDLPGKRTLPLSSFVKYIRGDDNYGDPETAEETYNYMNGKIGISGGDYIDPTTNQPSVFYGNGDPVTGAGWLDAMDHPSGDRRFLMTSGPFTMAPGDTQEVVGCVIIGAGPDPLTSVLVFKYFDKFAQNAFDSNFDLCSPVAPDVTVAQLDKKVILSWETNLDEVTDYNCLGYNFQGYNVYQGESPTGPWQRIATYDEIDEVKIITDETLDLNTGLLLSQPVQFGDDTGLLHYVEIDQDAVRGNAALINNRVYYFTVTSYAYDGATAPKTIESTFKPLTVVPGNTGVGNTLANTYDDVIDVVHSTGVAATQFNPIVIDPYLLTNLDYDITINIVDSVHHWTLTQGSDVILDSTLFPVTQDYFDALTDAAGGVEPTDVYVNKQITDGFIFTAEQGMFDITGADSAYASVDADTSTSLVFSGLGAGGDADYWAAFINFLNVAYNGLVPAPDGMPTNDLLQRDVEIRFSETGSIASYYNVQVLTGSATADTLMVPFELWDTQDDRRINVAVYQVAGAKPARWWALDDSLTYKFTANIQIIPVFEDYNATATYDFADDASKMGWVIGFNSGTSRFEFDNIFRLVFPNPLIAGTDTFTFNGSGVTTSSSISSDLDQIGVYPNPYYGHNPEERNPQEHIVYITNLGVGTTTIRIFTLSGDLVSKMTHTIDDVNDSDRRVSWDMRNRAGVPVASGMYLIHVDVEDSSGKNIGERILKLAVFQPEERLGIY